MKKLLAIIGAVAIIFILFFAIVGAGGYFEYPWETGEMTGSWGIEIKIIDIYGEEHDISPAPLTITIGGVPAERVLLTLHCKATSEIPGEISTVTLDFDTSDPFTLHRMLYYVPPGGTGVEQPDYTVDTSFATHQAEVVPLDGEYHSIWTGVIPESYPDESLSSIFEDLPAGDYYLRLSLGGELHYVTDVGTEGTISTPGNVLLIYFTKEYGQVIFDWDFTWS